MRETEQVTTERSITVEELSQSLKNFTSIDYVIFIGMLLTCTLIGFYFGYKDQEIRKRYKKQGVGYSEANSYLMGGRNMPVFPIALSLTASYVSGTVLLGTATEVYLFGMQYVYIVFAIIISGLALHFIIIPVFHDLHITSTYEYLEIRFDKKLRFFGSLMFMIGVTLFLPIVVYVPALAFNQITGIGVHTTAPLIMVVCIFYTCLGGMKAVVWTDVIQLIVLFGTLLTISFKGTQRAGGFSEVMRKNLESGRLEWPDFRIDPTIRHSFWTLCVGGGLFVASATGLNQNMIQRYMSVSSVKKARTSNFINTIGMIVIVTLGCYNGLIIYAKYSDCDPLSTRLAQNKDQLLPLLVMDAFSDIPGVAGLFVAGVFSAALSTLSTAYNSMAAVVFEDFIKTFAKKDISEAMTFFIMRATVLVLGSISVALVYVAQHMGQILQLTISIPASSLGPMLGIFIIGLMIPWIGKKSSFYSVIVVYFTMLVFVLKMQLQVAQGSIKYDTKKVSTEGCTYNYTTTPLTTTLSPPEEELEIAKRTISYLYLTLIGALLVIILSSILSFFFGFEDAKKIDSRLLAPFMRRFIRSQSTQLQSSNNNNGTVVVTHQFEMNEGVIHDKH